ncbi:MAG: methionine adenosyltransferase [Oscillospiraceae bacterium]|nr:methionine adenosyltransferase [Oscillospiraceae bacterium]
MKKHFTSESVTEGHPDKVCDQISDAVLDAILANDPAARVACETIVTTGMALVMGEISTTHYADIPNIVRDTIAEIGYDEPAHGFDARSCAVLTSIDEQSPDIAMGVDREGAGDQGMMFGYACDETSELMPAAITYSHALCRELAAARRDRSLPFLRPDGKAQVTVQYGDNGKVERIQAVVVSSQHDDMDIDVLRKGIRERVINKVLPKELIDEDTLYYINPTGRFVVGGPQGDSGLTGRKIIVDTYGGYGRHGGGCFSGKDPTKVDRSAAYMARYAAKNLVAAGLCSKCEIELAYAIGVAKPMSILVDTFGTGVVPDGKLADAVNDVFDFRPAEIIKTLDLRRPIYKPLASYGHFGRAGTPWEKIDRVDALKDAVK